MAQKIDNGEKMKKSALALIIALITTAVVPAHADEWKYPNLTDAILVGGTCAGGALWSGGIAAGRKLTPAGIRNAALIGCVAGVILVGGGILYLSVGPAEAADLTEDQINEMMKTGDAVFVENGEDSATQAQE